MKSRLYQILPALVISSLLFWVSTVSAQVSSVFVRNFPQSYIVQEGDTIRDIAGQFLADPSSWSDFWQPTPFRDDDDEISPGDVIRVEFINGRARLVAQRGDLAVERMAPQMRVIGVTSEIPAIPLEDIQSSFTSNRIVVEEAFDSAPHIVTPLGNKLVVGTGDELFARGDWPAGVTSFEIYREVNRFRDPEDSSVRTVEVATIGSAAVVGEESTNMMRLRVNRSNLEIKEGDRLMPGEDMRYSSVIYPTEPEREVSGRIIEMTNTERMASQLDTVLIDVGSRDGLEVGHILSIMQLGDEIVDTTERESRNWFGRLFARASNQTVELPRLEVGTILVYRVFDNLSYGVILTSSEPSRIGDLVVNP